MSSSQSSSESLRILFLGTPQFAATCLEHLLQSQHKVVGVVTAPDRPAGRGRTLRASEVKQVALAHNLPLAQPEKLKSPEFRALLDEWDAETAPSTPKPEAVKKSALTPREEAGIARMDARWQGVARAHLEYGVPPPHSFPFQEWARLDDALTALANDCPAMTTLRQAGSFLGVFLTDGRFQGHKFTLSVANALFCFATRDALSCIEWRVFEGVEFGPLPHKINQMKLQSKSNAVHDGLLGPYIQKCSNDAPCPHYWLESVTAFARSTAHFYPTRGASRSRSGDSADGKKRIPGTWLGSSRRAVQLGLAATPAFEDGEMAGDGSVSASDGIRIAHMDVTQSEIEFLLDLKAQRLRH